MPGVMISAIFHAYKKNKVNKIYKSMIFHHQFHTLEVLLEPMMKFKVKEVTRQDPFTIVQLEPLIVPLLLEEEIPAGCIQHIISNLSKHGKESKELCDRICEILCKIDLDNDSSRKIKQRLWNNTFTQLTTKIHSEDTKELRCSLKCSELTKVQLLQELSFMF